MPSSSASGLVSSCCSFSPSASTSTVTLTSCLPRRLHPISGPDSSLSLIMYHDPAATTTASHWDHSSQVLPHEVRGWCNATFALLAFAVTLTHLLLPQNSASLVFAGLAVAADLTLNLSLAGPSCRALLQVMTPSAGYCSGSRRMVSRLMRLEKRGPRLLCCPPRAAALPGSGAGTIGAAAVPSDSARSIRRPLTSNSQEGGPVHSFCASPACLHSTQHSCHVAWQLG